MANIDKVIGKIHRPREEMVFEWCIPQFSALPDKMDDHYHSSVFTFLDTFWYLKIFPNGESADQSEGYIALYLMVKENAPHSTVRVTFSFKHVDGHGEDSTELSHKFEKADVGCGYPRLKKRSEILRRKSDLLPDDVLTVCCTLKSNERQLTNVSLYERLLNTSRNMLDILKGKKRTDIILKVDGQEMEAHKIILEARSEVFRKMLSHDMIESKTGEIKIDDIEADVFGQVLEYMYGGRAKVTVQNTFSLYIAADKYDLQELKTLCTTFMEDNMSDDIFCDVCTIADTFADMELMLVAREYLAEHSEGIIETEKWKKFVTENPPLAIQMLTMMVKINGSKCAKK